jgi:hypothetical protein
MLDREGGLGREELEQFPCGGVERPPVVRPIRSQHPDRPALDHQGRDRENLGAERLDPVVGGLEPERCGDPAPAIPDDHLLSQVGLGEPTPFRPDRDSDRLQGFLHRQGRYRLEPLAIGISQEDADAIQLQHRFGGLEEAVEPLLECEWHLDLEARPVECLQRLLLVPECWRSCTFASRFQCAPPGFLRLVS